MSVAAMRTADAFSCLDFGASEPAPAVRALSGQLNDILLALQAEAPDPVAAAIRARLDAYPGPGRRFIDLFYVPAWSFLHWAPALFVRNDDGALSDAREVHALSLLLHLWDDHLMDGQMPPDMAAIQMRTIAWSRFRAATERLSRSTGGTAAAQRLIDAYLGSHRTGSGPATLDAFLARFLDQIGIWRVAPSLLGRMMDPPAGDGLLRILDLHATAWRMMDDLQDARADCRRGRNTAVRLALPAEGRALWDLVQSSPDPAEAAARWDRVVEAIETRPAADLRTRIDHALAEAIALAGGLGLDGLEAELQAARARRTVVKQLLRENPERI